MFKYDYFKFKTFTCKYLKNKVVELQIEFNNEYTAIFDFGFDITRKCDYAGGALNIELLKLILFRIDFYDTRHWNDETNDWEVYE